MIAEQNLPLGRRSALAVAMLQLHINNVVTIYGQQVLKAGIFVVFDEHDLPTEAPSDYVMLQTLHEQITTRKDRTLEVTPKYKGWFKNDAKLS